VPFVDSPLLNSSHSILHWLLQLGKVVAKFDLLCKETPQPVELDKDDRVTIVAEGTNVCTTEVDPTELACYREQILKHLDQTTDLGYSPLEINGMLLDGYFAVDFLFNSWLLLPKNVLVYGDFCGYVHGIS